MAGNRIPAVEGYVPFRGWRTWYQMIGKDAPGRLPLLCLHGGPGFPHDALEPLEALASSGRRVIFYDQLGCGNSDRPRDPSLWSVDLFMDELRTVVRNLDLGRYHMLGHSWGGMLAMEFTLKNPQRPTSLILSNSTASIPLWASEANRLRGELPSGTQEILKKHEEAGTTDDPEYEEAMMEYYRRHVCRLDPWPDCLMRSISKLVEDPEVYNNMFGPSEFCVTGTLKDWDITGRLGEIAVPAMIVSGRFDEATPEISRVLHEGIMGSRWVLMQNSSHMAHLEEPEEYLRTVDDFLSEVEGD